MNHDVLLTRARKFWKCAATALPDLERRHPQRKKALEFDRWSGKRVLDYGCGGGSDVLSFLRRGCDVVAADIVEANVATTMMRARDDDDGLRFHDKLAGARLEIPWVLPFGRSSQNGAPSATLPGYEGTFDAISAYHVLHHVPFDLATEIVRELVRVLIPIGRLYTTLYTNLVEIEYGRRVGDLMRRYHVASEEALAWLTDGEGCPYVEVYSEARSLDLFKRCGLVVESTFEFDDGWSRTYRCRKVL